MEIWTFAFAAFGLQALTGLVRVGMVLQLLPAVTHIAVEAILTSKVIIINVVFEFPVKAGDGFVGVVGRVAAIVLQVMGVHAQSLVMLGEVEGAELGLVVEHVEVFVELVVVNEFGPDLVLAVREGAEVSVLTLLHVVRKVRAELLLIGLMLVELLHA